MSALRRTLYYQLPMMRGRDVVALQRRLRALGFTALGQPDGLYGPATERAVRAFQRKRGLQVDGIAGPIVFSHLFEEAEPSQTAKDEWLANVRRLTRAHRRFVGSIEWALTPQGVSIDGQPPTGTLGEPKTVKRIWTAYERSIRRWGRDFGVPVELIVATICTESGGDPNARREEEGFESASTTPHRVSIGLMQTLLSTAQETLRLDGITEQWLLEPDNSIRAGTGYIAKQSDWTLFDPPVVACAYNAGGVYENTGADNRWCMRQYPLGTGKHADRFVEWFNDCFRAFDAGTIEPPSKDGTEPSLYQAVRLLG